MRLKTLLYFLVIYLIQLNAFGQKQVDFSTGISIDPSIEKICKSKKKTLNSFKIIQFTNDTIVEKSFLGAMSGLPISSYVSINKKDTSITFMNMFVPIGFQIQFKNDSTNFETFISTKSCKCFKSNLGESSLSYGAGNKPDTFILVLSKRQNLKKGDTIFGYIKTIGGNIYNFSDEGSKYSTKRYEYEGYFEIKFDSYLD
jgi:hypothetical protein